MGVVVIKKNDLETKINLEKLKQVVTNTIDDKKYNKDVLKNIREETKENLKYISNPKDDMYNPFKDLLNKWIIYYITDQKKDYLIWR